MKGELFIWQKPYGWRAGSRYVEPGASAADVIQYEQGELGNSLNVPRFLLNELTAKQIPARDIVWICRTRHAARRYSGRQRGQPYKEDVSPLALVVASDGEEPEPGYLVLNHADRLSLPVLDQFASYRREKRMKPQEVLQFEGIPIRTQLQGYHVTDNPTRIEGVLARGESLIDPTDNRFHDLRTPGLYISDAPQLWTGRSEQIWNFTKNLSVEKRQAIAHAVLQQSMFTDERGLYLTPDEQERARSYMQRYSETGNDFYLAFIAGQPYNIKVWKQAFLEPLGIAYTPLQMIAVEAKGYFADLSNVQITETLIEKLKKEGYDGAYVTSSMAYLPQAVIWENEAIVKCGNYHKPTPTS